MEYHERHSWTNRYMRKNSTLAAVAAIAWQHEAFDRTDYVAHEEFALYL